MSTSARRGLGLVCDGLRWVGMVIVAVLVVHIVLTLFDANPDNAWAAAVANLANALSLGLTNLFTPADPKLAVALNFGAAAVIWFVVTTVVVRLVRRLT